MTISARRSLLLGLFAITLSLSTGCSITTDVEPISPRHQFDKIYISHVDETHMEGLEPEMQKQIEAMGIDTEIYYNDQPPAGSQYRLTYTARWYWDMAMYLLHFKAHVYEGDTYIGMAEYDARRGGANMGKFGTTADKIRPLLQELFANQRKDEDATAADQSP